MPRIGVGVGLGLRARGRPQRPLRIIANLTRANYATDTTTAGNEMRQVRSPHYFGPQDVYEVRPVFANWWLDLGAGGREVATGNAVTLGYAMTYNGVTVVRETAYAMSDGETYVGLSFFPSEFGATKFTAGDQFFVRTMKKVTIGQKIARAGQYLSEAPASRLTSAAGADQLSGTGAYTGANNGTGPGPIMILGRTRAPMVSIIEIGDSIGEGQNDGNSYPSAALGGGMYARGAWGAGKTPIAHVGRHGGQLSRLFNGSPQEGAKRRLLYPYATHAFIHFGANDLFNPTTYAAEKALLVSEIATMRAAGIKHVTLGGISPRTNTTDAWATTVNQTSQASWDPTKSAAANADMAALGPGNDAFFDVNVDFGNGGAADKWVVTGAANYATSDGTHPSTALMTAAGARVTTLINSFTPY